MCLIAIAHRACAERPLVVAANRDEAYTRPTSPANFWGDYPDILAGRDLEAGGTWLGVDRYGRFAAVTNFREPATRMSGAPSRGDLVGDFLISAEPAAEYLRRIVTSAQRYNGFNLLISDVEGLYYFSNRDTGPVPRKLAPGIYGLSNHLLDTPWPKLVQARQRFAGAVAAGDKLETLMSVLTDKQAAADEALPDTGIGAARERLLSSVFVATETYGTRCSTLLEVSSTRRVRFIEQSFVQGGAPTDAVEYRFDLRTAEARA